MTRRSLYIQILLPVLIVMLGAVAVAIWGALVWMRGFYIHEKMIALEVRARLAQRQLGPCLLGGHAQDADLLCKEIARDALARITVVLPTGQVAGDSEESFEIMENHANRPEIEAALAGRIGRSQRYSRTVHSDSLYVAVPVPDGGRVAGAIRASASLASIDAAMHTVARRIAGGSILAALAGAAIVFALARRITRPLRQMELGARAFGGGELDRQLPIPNSAELATLAEAMNAMAADIRSRILAMARQKSELDSVLSSMTEGVLAVDTGDGVLSLNKAAVNMLGADGDTARGRDYLEVVRNACLQESIARVLKEREPFEEEISLATMDNRTLRVSATPLRGDGGNHLGALIVLDDISDVRKLERARSDFVANVSHEIRTPVTSIKGYAETLLFDPPGDAADARRFLDIIMRQADRLCALVDDILSLSALERSESSGAAAFETVALRGILEAALNACQPKANDKGIALTLECADGISARVNAGYIEQAVINLLDNAVKYSPAGGAVTLSAEALPDEVLIHVRDGGAGIAAEHLSRIFERFYRVDRARSRGLGGTGLGLAIVKHIAALHGGTVAVESVLGKGSRFTLHLPI